MPLSESVVLRIEEALGQLERLDARLNAIFSQQHNLRVDTRQAQRKVEALRRKIRSLSDTKVVIDVDVASSIAKLNQLTTATRSLTATGRSLSAFARNMRAVSDSVATLKPSGINRLNALSGAISNLNRALTVEGATAQGARVAIRALRDINETVASIAPSVANRFTNLAKAVRDFGSGVRALRTAGASFASTFSSIQQAIEQFTIEPAALRRFTEFAKPIAALGGGIRQLRAAGTAISDTLASVSDSLRAFNVPDVGVARLAATATHLRALGDAVRNMRGLDVRVPAALNNLSAAIRSFNVPQEAMSRLLATVSAVATTGERARGAATSLSRLASAITSLRTTVSSFAMQPIGLLALGQTLDHIALKAAAAQEAAASINRLNMAARGIAPPASAAAAATNKLNQATRDTRRAAVGARDALSGVAAAADNAKVSIGGIANQMLSLGRSMSLFVTLPILGVTTAAGALAFTFNEVVTRIRLLTSAIEFSEPHFERIKQGLKDIAAETGRTPRDVAEGFYFLASAVEAADARLSTLRVAAQAAAVGLGDVSQLTDALSSVINAYGRENITAAQAGDILVESVRAAKVEAAEFAPQLGRLLPLAAQLKLPFEQVGAALALLTRTGNSAAIAATQLRSFLLALVKPPQTAATALASVGLKFADIRKALQEGGLQGAISLLTSKFGENEEAITRLFRRQEAYLALLQIAERDFKDFNAILEDTRKAMDNPTGRLTIFDQFREQSKTLALRQELSKLLSMLTDMGQRVLPAATTGLNAFNLAFAQISRISTTPIAGDMLKIAAAIAALAGPALYASASLLKLSNIAADLPKITARFGASAVQAFTHTKSLSQAAERLHMPVEVLEARIARFGRLVDSSLRVALAGAAAGFSTLSASISGAMYASESATVRFIGLANALTTVGGGALVAGVQIGQVAGKFGGIAAAAATATAGVLAFITSMRQAKERQLREKIQGFINDLRSAEQAEILLRFNFIPDEKQTREAASRALEDARKLFEGFLNESDKLTEVEADMLVKVFTKGELNKDFDEFLRDFAVNGEAAIRRYAPILQRALIKSIIPSMTGELNRARENITAWARRTYESVLDLLKEGETVTGRTLSNLLSDALPDDLREFGKALAESNVLVAKLNDETGRIELQITDLDEAYRVLSGRVTDVTPLLQSITKELKDNGVIAAIAASKVREVSNSYGTLIEQADGDVQLIPHDAIDTVKEAQEAITALIENQRRLRGLGSEKRLRSALNDVIIDIRELKEELKDAKIKGNLFQAILDESNLDAEPIRDAIDEVIEDTIEYFSAATIEAAQKGDLKALDALVEVAEAHHAKMADVLAKSLGISVEKALEILASRDFTVEDLVLTIKEPNVKILAEEIRATELQLELLKALAKEVNIPLTLSPDFDAKGLDEKLDEVKSLVAQFVNASDPIAVDLAVRMVSLGPEGDNLLQQLMAEQLITREMLVEAVFNTMVRGDLKQSQLDALLKHETTSDIALEAVAMLKAEADDTSLKEALDDIKKSLEFREPVTIPVKVTADISTEKAAEELREFAHLFARGAPTPDGKYPKALTGEPVKEVTYTVKATADTREARRDLEKLTKEAESKEARVPVSLDTERAKKETDKLKKYIESIRPVISVDVRFNRLGLFPVPQATGGVVQPTRFNDGGLPREPMIAKATRGRGILWAEPETWGEAYIPFNPRHRRRALGILWFVADRFGYTLQPREAASGVVVNVPNVIPRVEGVGSLAAAINNLAAEVSRLADSTKHDNQQEAPLVENLSIISNVQDPRAAAMHIAAELSRVVRG